MLYFDLINPYITYMLIILLFAFSIYAIFTKRYFITKHKNIIFIIVMVLLIWTQIARYIGVFFDHDTEWSVGVFNFRIIAFTWTTHLPFYICRLSVLVLLYYVITKDKRVESFLFYWGATGLAGILYPNGDIQNIFKLTETFYIDHFFLGLTPFFLVVYQGYRPSRKDLFIITGLMFVILAAFIPINNIINSITSHIEDIEKADYFYVNEQSIVRVVFGELPSMVFVFIHTSVALGFFSIYYFLFRNKVYEIKFFIFHFFLNK